MCDLLKKEFTLSNFGLTYDKRKAFTSPQWKWHPMVFLTYRVLVALYTTGFFFVNLILAYINGNNNILAFLTIWTYLVLSIYFLSAAEVAIVARNRESRGLEPQTADVAGMNDKGIENAAYVELGNVSIHNKDVAIKVNDNRGSAATHSAENDPIEEDLTITMKFTWILGNIVQVCAIIVSVVYFTALYPLVGHTNFVDINYHGMNTVFVLLDACIAARPVRLLHVVYPVVYGLVYIAFSAVFWSFDHVNNVLYPGVLDWNYPGHTLLWVIGLAVGVMPLLQLAFYGVFRLRLYLYRRCYDVEF